MPDIKLPPKFRPMFKPKRIKVYFGGRGGAKTESFARIALIQATSQQKRFLCLREFMNSIEDSVHATLEEIINQEGFSPFFDVLANRIDSIDPKTGANLGNRFKYGQLARNLSSIKSKGQFDVAWIEEAETISQKSIDVLEPTIRKSGSELWYSFNPDDEFGPIYSKYVKPYKEIIDRDGFYEDEDIYVCKVGLEDNPFAGPELLRMSEKAKEENYKAWLHIWGGEPYGDYSDSIIQPEWVRASVDAHKKLGFEPLGIKVLGFDPADEGEDAKALIGRHGSVVTSGKMWGGGDINEAIAKAFDEAVEGSYDMFVYDSIGVGTAVKTAIAMRDPMGKIVHVPFCGSEAVENPKAKHTDRSNEQTFKNRRAQFWWYLRERFHRTWEAVEQGKYHDPETLISLSSDIEDLDTLRAELSRPRRVRRPGSSLIQVESKREMIKRDVKSPNMADALVYDFANPAPDEVEEDIEFLSEWG